MSMSNVFETEILELILNNVAAPLIGDAAGLQPSAVAGSVYISLHTADPGEAGNQETSEATYTGYARIAVARTAGGWTVVGDTASNTADVTFDPCTAGSNTISHFAIGTALSGAGKVLFYGALTAPQLVDAGKTPRFNAGTLTVTAN